MKNFPEQPPTEQDRESIVDPQSKLQPNESLALAGQVKYPVFHCYPPETPSWRAAKVAAVQMVFCTQRGNGMKQVNAKSA